MSFYVLKLALIEHSVIIYCNYYWYAIVNIFHVRKILLKI